MFICQTKHQHPQSTEQAGGNRDVFPKWYYGKLCELICDGWIEENNIDGQNLDFKSLTCFLPCATPYKNHWPPFPELSGGTSGDRVEIKHKSLVCAACQEHFQHNQHLPCAQSWNWPIAAPCGGQVKNCIWPGKSCWQKTLYHRPENVDRSFNYHWGQSQLLICVFLGL